MITAIERNVPHLEREFRTSPWQCLFLAHPPLSLDYSNRIGYRDVGKRINYWDRRFSGQKAKERKIGRAHGGYLKVQHEMKSRPRDISAVQVAFDCAFDWTLSRNCRINSGLNKREKTVPHRSHHKHN
jgi:hypothetical protein